MMKLPTQANTAFELLEATGYGAFPVGGAGWSLEPAAF